MIIDLNVKIKTIKILEINIGENLCDLKLCKDFFGLTPKIQSIFLMTHFITKDLKFLLFERYYENEKTRQRLGYSICKSYIVSDKGLDPHIW